jgi:PAS domain S-box-containing protein
MSRQTTDNNKLVPEPIGGQDSTIAEKAPLRAAPTDSGDDYRLVIENASQGIVIAQENAIRYANPKATEYTGYTREELTSRPFIELIHPDDREIVIRQHQDVLLGNVPSGHLNHRIIDREGRTRWMEVTGVPFTWEGVPSTLLFISDITTQKETEDRLRQSQERYRDLVENTGDLLYVTDGEGNYKFVNQTIEREYGYTPSDLLGRGFRDIITPQSLALATEVFKKQLKGIDVGRVEHDIYDKNGQIRTIETKERLVWEGNRVVEIYGIARDVTDRKRAEAALRESEEKYRSLVENLNDVICSTDLEGRVTYVSPAVEKITGYPVREIVGRLITDFIYPDDLPVFMDSHARTLEGQEEPLEFRAIHNNGDIIHVRTFSRPQYINGVLVGLTGTITDISERIKTETALKESEEKYRLILENAVDGIAIAYEAELGYVNPPMTKYLGYTREELLERPFLDFIYPDDREGVINTHLTLMQGGTDTITATRRFNAKNGTVLWASYTSVSVTWGGQRAVLSFVKDVTEEKRVLDALAESEEKYRLVVENANEVIVITRNGIVEFANNRVMTLFGVPPSALLGKHLSQLVVGSEREKLREELRELISGKEALPYYRYRMQDAKGTIRCIEVNGIPITWDGRPSILSFVSDITQKVRAEEEIKWRLRYEQAVAFCSQEMVSSTDIDGAMQNIVRHLLEKLTVGGVFICKNVMDPVDGLSMLTITEATSDRHKAAFGLTIPDKVPYKYRSPEMLDALSKGRWFGGPTKDYPSIDRDILAIIGSLSSVMIPIFVSDTFWGFIGFDDYETERTWDGQDILLLQTISSMIGTAIARKDAETALTESERRYRGLVNNTNDIIYVADFKGNIKFMNNAVRQMGYEPNEVIERNFNEFYAPSSMEYAQELFRLQRFGARLRGYELDIIRKDGQVRTIEFNEELKWEGGRIVEVRGIGRDVTDRKKMEDRLRLIAVSQEAVLNSLPDMIFFADLSLKITWANRASSQLTGFSIEELVGRFCHEVLHQKDAPCEGCPAVASLATGRFEKNDSVSCFGKNRRVTAYPVPDLSGSTTGIAVSIGSIESKDLLDITEGLSQLDDDIEQDSGSEIFLAPLDPNYIYPFSLSIDLQKDTFVITLRWDSCSKQHLLKRLTRSESAVARFVYLAARMKTDGSGWVDKDVIRAGTMDTNLNKLRSLLEDSNVPFLDRFSSRMLIRSNREEKKKVRLALSAANIEISPEIKNFKSKKHRYMNAVVKRIKTLEREMKKLSQPKEYLISELNIQRQNEVNLKKSIEVVESLIGDSVILLKF